MGTQLADLEVNEISGVDHPANLHEGWLVMKSSEDSLDQAATSALEAADQTVNKGEDAVDLTVADPVEAIDKAADETPEVADFRKEMADLKKALDDARTEAETLKNERDLEKAVARAADWANVPGVDPADFGPVLRSLTAAAPEEAAKVEEILDATAQALTATDDLTKEIGTDAAPESATGWDEIQTLAKSIVDEGRAPSIEAAIGMAATENPAAYQRHLNEKGA